MDGFGSVFVVSEQDVTAPESQPFPRHEHVIPQEQPNKMPSSHAIAL